MAEPKRYVRLADGRAIGLGRYVAAWKACKALPDGTPIGRGPPPSIRLASLCDGCRAT